MKAGRPSQIIALLGLAAVTAALVYRLPYGAAQLITLPPLVLLAAGVRPAARWGGWAAVLMIPYFCVGVADTLVTVDARWPGALITFGALAVFFAGLDSVRRSGASLRR